MHVSEETECEQRKVFEMEVACFSSPSTPSILDLDRVHRRFDVHFPPSPKRHLPLCPLHTEQPWKNLLNPHQREGSGLSGTRWFLIAPLPFCLVSIYGAGLTLSLPVSPTCFRCLGSTAAVISPSQVPQSFQELNKLARTCYPHVSRKHFYGLVVFPDNTCDCVTFLAASLHFYFIFLRKGSQHFGGCVSHLSNGHDRAGRAILPGHKHIHHSGESGAEPN